MLTNQSGVGRGIYTEDDVRACNDRMIALLRDEGVELEAIYHCPHAPEENCACRKPATGLMEKAAERLGFEPADAWMVGDKEADIRLGRNCGARTVLVRTGKGREAEEKCGGLANFVVDNLAEAARIIEERS
ncbi:D-glycero-alpha-D-manno-heptose-1,7-bisphosphate 7-phosphatase [Salidesulfovibrio brasiliensis]|uniref:D-glycero-alpha-D-manno-heptose-1,7-bisphosphate 7-phosphatase n=1 Tax=Salidesulfovibrio brasiliensis TaxID=221711 RepID=UPI000AEFAAD5